MKAKMLFFAALAVFLANAALVAGGNSGKKSRKLVVASKNHTESIVWAHVITEMIRGNSDIEVELKENMGGTFVVFAAMKSGDIDLYPDYTGTLYSANLKKTEKVSEDESLRIIQREMQQKHQMKVYEPYGYNNEYVIAMLRPKAEKLGIEKISDLEQHRDLIAGFNSEFMAREVDGPKPMFAHYGFEPANPMVQLEIGLRYAAAIEGKIDYFEAFSTDAKLKRFDIKLLEDDKVFFAPYYGVTVVREDTLKRFPELDGILKRLEWITTSPGALDLNFEVEENNRRPQDVVIEYLKAEGLIP